MPELLRALAFGFYFLKQRKMLWMELIGSELKKCYWKCFISV